ncbi:hypothetical protein L873DRAFT_1794280 [Choiromyces venosus 120613-1]|uniref:F-box domain-containing protein n=1 Tax=Choiromyces venosus 120613-1 TaxID=1336337 RepID=A0A3N4J1Z8_9PEZI|nr:hypothetical protein L873DRAFT_1794280 [Choiromyces venosus 120613-1]
MVFCCAYCPLCGGPWNVDDFDSDDEVLENEIKEWEETTGLKAVSLKEVNWCTKIRVISSKEHDSNCKPSGPIPKYRKGDESYTYISGIGKGGMYGGARVPMGYNEIIDEPDESGEEPLLVYIDVYNSDAAIVHDNCFMFLNQALGKYRPSGVEGSVHLDVIWKFLFNHLDYGVCTDFDYLLPEHSLLIAQYWDGNRCENGWTIANFLECEELENYMANPPIIAKGTPITYANRGRDVSGSLFNLLPTEVLTSMLHLLPDVDLRSARLASRTLADIPFTQGFWESRVRVDLPIWEVKYVPHGSKVDWRKVYEELAIKGDTCQIRGWRNRWRMWRLFRRSMVNELWEAELMERNEWASYVTDKADSVLRAAENEGH